MFNLRKAFRLGRPIPLMADVSPGYHPNVRLGVAIGVGNAPQYVVDAQMIALASASGGGTLAGNPPSATQVPLDFAEHMIGAPIQQGTYTPSRTLMGLAPENWNVSNRR